MINECFFFLYKITLYTGAVVKYRIGEDWIYEIQIFPSIFDEDNVEGLCGNPNGNIEDDFIPKGQSSSIDDQTEFQKSWRYKAFYILYYTLQVVIMSFVHLLPCLNRVNCFSFPQGD